MTLFPTLTTATKRLARITVLFGLLLTASMIAPPAEGQGYHVGLLGGVGGAVDGDPFDHRSIEAQFGYQRGIRDLVMVRIGQLDLDSSDDLFAFDGELTWLTVSSEYRLPEDFYLSGIFFGLGYFQRRGDLGLADDEGVGVTLGINGEFAITERWGVLLQLSGYWADLDDEQGWTTAMAGVTFSF
ncbi:MAG: hypothetical protein MPN21_11540 [Thermoanaerobaculia bacterium]|nr:hypothetical protein [Thermoanaerobaculia bacterium]